MTLEYRTCLLRVIRVAFVMSANVRFQGNFGHSGPHWHLRSDHEWPGGGAWAKIPPKKNRTNLIDFTPRFLPVT